MQKSIPVPELILIDVLHNSSVRIAILDKRGDLCDFFFYRDDESSNLHSIFLGTVTAVEPSLESAFVECGMQKNGFLPYRNIHKDYFQLPSDGIASEVHQSSKVDLDDNLDDNLDESSAIDVQMHQKYSIKDVIKKGQKMLVQVCKDGRGSKGSSLTTYITLTSRCCILSPNARSGVGISSRIVNPVERRRLADIARSFPGVSDMKVIIRTAAEGMDAESIRADYNSLLGLWKNITANALNTPGHALMYADSEIGRVIIDKYSQTIKKVIVDKRVYREVKDVFDNSLPNESVEIVEYSSKVPMFQKYSVEDKIRTLLQDKVYLESGGSIVIHPTEALVAIDVNSGKGKLGADVENMALKTNLQAVDVIAREARLRSLSGLIVVDFIDMETEENRRKVEEAMKDAFSNDKARVQLGRISGLGLMQLSRQRTNPSLAELITIPCPSCSGSGRVMSGEFVSNSIVGALLGVFNSDTSLNGSSIVVNCSDVVAHFISNNNVKNTLEQIGEQFHVDIKVEVNLSFVQDEFTVEKVEVSNGGEAIMLIDNKRKDHCSNNSKYGFLSRILRKFRC